MITKFTGDWNVLSNFYQHPFQLDYRDHWFKSGEHAFQAAKATSVFDYQKILQAPTPAAAKKLGREITLTEGWDERKREIMLEIVMAKFAIPELRQRLINTGTEVLVEGNTWNDVYWGAVPAPLTVSFRRGPGFPEGKLPVWRPGGYASEWLTGCNWLGRLLMTVREVITP